MKRSSAGIKSSFPSFQWTCEHEIVLFQAILTGTGGRKPGGIAKHFQMAAIHDLLSKGLSTEVARMAYSCLIFLSSVPGMKDVTAGSIWEQLECLYDLEAIDELENESRNPDEKEFTEFSLPKKEFLAVISEMRDSGTIPTVKEATASALSSGFTSAPSPAAASSSSTPTSKKSGAADRSSASLKENQAKADQEPNKTASKRPTRSTPSSTPAKRRK